MTYTDAALVLVGHGSTQNPDSCQTVRQQAGELREDRLFAEVREGFLRQEPFIADAFSRITARRVFVVPMFISEGYITEQVIPRKLGLFADGQQDYARMQQRGSQRLYYCNPIGTHPSMTGVLRSRAEEIVRKHPFPYAPRPQEIALFIVGHGTPKDENSRAAIDRQVERIRGLNLYAEVHAVFLEEDPCVSDCYELSLTKNVVVVPFFISDGLHVREDIPVLLGESEHVVQARRQQGLPSWRNPTEHHGKRVWYTDSIGSDPRLSWVILERVREAVEHEAEG